MKKTILLLTFFLSNLLLSQEKSQTWIYPPENLSTSEAMDFVIDYLGLPNNYSFVKIKAETDFLGKTHEYYEQYYNGVKLDIGMFRVHSEKRIVKLINGEVSKIVKVDTKPRFSIEEAYKIANPYTKDVSDKVKGELIIIEVDRLGYQLAYKFDVYTLKPLKREWVYVSAITKEILDRESRIHEVDVPASGVSLYNGTVNFTATEMGMQLVLRQSQSGNGIRTFDMNGGTNYSAFDFASSTNFFNTGNEIGVQAHWGAEQTYAYFLDNHGRNSYDNNGGVINSYVSANLIAMGSSSNVNAFWDGSKMTYGDGNGTTHGPMVSLDIVGHEITHGVTQHSAKLKYKKESGALNESFSDIFGECIENFATGTNNWRMGTDTGIGGDGAIRSMQTPNSFNQPDTYKGDNWFTGIGDHGGVHTNSGVQNKWFFILSNGESGTNDKGHSYNVTGIGIEKAAKIAYRNLTVYLSKNSKYSDARKGAIQAAIDLYGHCSDEVIATTNAWYAVGVGKSFDDYEVASLSEIKTFKLIENELFVGVNTLGGSYLLKIKNDGGSGQNMYAINYSGGSFQSVDGYSYLVGQQEFKSAIVDILYIGGNTIIAFKNGKVLKINGTGGTGHNMFAVTETVSGFETVPGYSYRLGDAKFNGKITKMLYADNKLIIALDNKKILKVNGTGGTGYNMFAVTETATGFETVPGYSYRVGDAMFSGYITNAAYIDNKLIMTFNNGKILKVNGTGGTGHNMFAVTETASGFETVPGYTYRLGDAKFSASVHELGYFDNKLILSFYNGKMLKINGTGGTGHNMFAVTETTSGFETISGYSYRIGDAKFEGYATKMIYVDNKLILGFSNGKMLKVNGTGGSGHNMFAVTETLSGFNSVPGYNYRIGDTRLGGRITDIDYISNGNVLIISSSIGNSLKVNGIGGSGHNMFALYATTCKNAYIGLPGYNYYVGFQEFNGIPLFLKGTKTKDNEVAQEEEATQNMIESGDVSVYPNPTSGEINIRFIKNDGFRSLEIYNLLGKQIFKKENITAPNTIVNLKEQSKGIYIVKVNYEDKVIMKKILLE